MFLDLQFIDLYQTSAFISGQACWATKYEQWKGLCNPVGHLPPEFSENHFATARTNLEGACVQFY